MEPFVDDDAEPAIAEKVKRRLGHWLDRRIAQHFAPLVALRDDESLTGMARGIAFRLVEALGVLPRGEIAEEVKGLDQDSRATLRKHGVRFGQHTVFLPLLLKPAPTRLRLVLWSLKQGFDVFPEAPPPGLVTVPAVPGAPAGYYPRAGYRLAGERAVRIDMLERLADMVRALDARAGFEATPEMLSITGLSLEQFAKLMQGLGYRATEGTRPKRRPAPAEAPAADAGTAPAEAAAEAEAGDAGTAPAEPVAEPEARRRGRACRGGRGTRSRRRRGRSLPSRSRKPKPRPPAIPSRTRRSPRCRFPPTPTSRRRSRPTCRRRSSPTCRSRTPRTSPSRSRPRSPSATRRRSCEPAAEASPEEVETFYVFVRAQRPRHERPEARPERKRPGKPPPKRAPRSAAAGEADKGQDGAREPKRPDKKPPPRPQKPIDPDNPFAALMALKLGR